MYDINVLPELVIGDTKKKYWLPVRWI